MRLYIGWLGVLKAERDLMERKERGHMACPSVYMSLSLNLVKATKTTDTSRKYSSFQPRTLTTLLKVLFDEMGVMMLQRWQDIIKQ